MNPNTNDTTISSNNNSNLSLLDLVRRATRLKHYSIRTEQTYIEWIKRFINFHKQRHPMEMGAKEITEFLSYLAINRNVAPNTQSIALNAIMFLYNKVLKLPIEPVSDFARPRKKTKLPVVFTQDEVRKVLKELSGSYWLATCLLYGSGLRLMEAMRLRVMNINFEHKCLYILNAKGGKDRIVTFPDELIVPLQQHLEKVKMLHNKDLADGFGKVYLPHALERKYPSAPAQWGWAAPVPP